VWRGQASPAPALGGSVESEPHTLAGMGTGEPNGAPNPKLHHPTKDAPQSGRHLLSARNAQIFRELIRIAVVVLERNVQIGHCLSSARPRTRAELDLRRRAWRLFLLGLLQFSNFLLRSALSKSGDPA
jgi:hypothetical protein